MCELMCVYVCARVCVRVRETERERERQADRQKDRQTKFVHLFGWFLWHINFCRLFNAKSIFIQINSSISNNSV